LAKDGLKLLLAGLCILALKPSLAQTAQGHAGDKLKMVVILSRHGVRSPTWTKERLDGYSVQPWPQWSVPPGDLTVRGHQLLKLFGTFDRASLAEAGLFAAHGCADAAASYIWADTDQRTLESGHALAEGLFSGCTLAIHNLAEGENDPLFHPAAEGVAADEADAAFAEFEARVKHQSATKATAAQDELIQRVQHILQGCAPAASCLPARAPQTPLLGSETAAVRGKGDHLVDLKGPLAQASSFSEDFLLEYADGMPLSSVGWGNVNETDLRRLLPLHTDYFDLMHRTPALARIEASNMLFHIERTLQQGIEGQPVADALGPAASKLVLLVGHDTNLAGIAELIGVHWHLDGRDDDTPPGIQLAFELWQDAHDNYSVRVTIAMQTLPQLREMKPLTLNAPPARETLTLQGCAAAKQGCPWEDFRRIADAAINTKAVLTQPSN
jgi:4-phytase / acid phosphatase